MAHRQEDTPEDCDYSLPIHVPAQQDASEAGSCESHRALALSRSPLAATRHCKYLPLKHESMGHNRCTAHLEFFNFAGLARDPHNSSDPHLGPAP